MSDNQSPELFGQTPWQTVGPFFHYALPWHCGADLVGNSEIGARPELFPSDHDLLNRPTARSLDPSDAVEIRGRVTDGKGLPVPDALLEIWQADPDGHYGRSADFSGFGRCATGEDGAYSFLTLYPGRVPGPDGAPQAPHIAISIFGRGILRRLVTRLYFEGGDGNDEDPILTLAPMERRATLIAARAGDRQWRFDIVLQGPNETVFLAI